MFSCACSLRSAQCAALIALATAAGITRFEEPQKPAEVAAPEACRAEESAAFARAQRTEAFHLVLARVVPWLFLAVPEQTLAAELRSDSGDGHARPSAPGDWRGWEVPSDAFAANGFVEIGSTVRAGTTLGMPSPRTHSFPFAVGPPLAVRTQTERVVGTAVPGDSAARSWSVEDFATCLFAPSRHNRGRRLSEEFAGLFTLSAGRCPEAGAKRGSKWMLGCAAGAETSAAS